MIKFKHFLPLIIALSALSGCNSETPEECTCQECPTCKECEEPHVHTFKETYSSNETMHWQEATCSHSELTQNLGEHTFVNGVCSVCGKLEHVHHYVNGVCECGAIFDSRSKLEYKDTSTLDDLLEEFVPEEMKSGFIYNFAVSMAKGFEANGVGEGEVTYKRYSFTYPSKRIDGSDVMLSGAITIPHLDGNPVSKSVVIASHPTFTDLSEAPSNGFEIYTIPALTGSILIECDLLGYGISKDEPVDYHCKHLSTKHTIDGIFAARDLLDQSFNLDIFSLYFYNIGYSQGGYDSLALLRYMETEATQVEKNSIRIDTTFSGSGAYNPMLLFEEALKNKNSYEYSEYILMAIMSEFNFHKEDIAGYTYEDILTPQGLELLEILKEKNDEHLQAYKKANMFYPEDIFVEEWFEEDSALVEAFRVISKESLLDEDWTPEGQLYIYYSSEDEIVTYKCSLAAKELWGTQENIEYATIGAIGGKDHRGAAVDYYINVVALIIDLNNIREEGE